MSSTERTTLADRLRKEWAALYFPPGKFPTLNETWTNLFNKVEALEAERAGEMEKVRNEHELELESLLVFAREREAFGIQTDIQNRPYDDGDGHRTKGNPRGEAYGGGYAEAAQHFKEEIEAFIDDALAPTDGKEEK